MVAYERLKTIENFELLALKLVAVAYERWSLTRGSKCSDLTWKLLVFWKTDRSGEVVATGGSTVFRICFTLTNVPIDLIFSDIDKNFYYVHIFRDCNVEILR